MQKILMTFIVLLITSCTIPNKPKTYQIYLQPYNDFSVEEAKLLQTDIQNCFDTLIPEIRVNIQILEPKTLSKQFMISKRYRADSIIRNQHSVSGYILGLTHSDISCTAHNINDYGVLGLSTCPGHSAVISDYRVSNKSLFYKVGVHELLHCFKLHHCPNNDRKCYICDANRKPQLEKQIYLCETCKEKLLN